MGTGPRSGRRILAFTSPKKRRKRTMPSSDHPPAPTYIENVLSSASTLNVADRATHMTETLATSPCLKPTLQWAAVVGSLLVAHRGWQGGSLRRCANDAFLGGLGTAGYQWYTCRVGEHDRRLVMKAYADSQRSSPNGVVGAGASPGGSGGSASTAGGAAAGAGGGDDAWRKKLEGMVVKG